MSNRIIARSFLATALLAMAVTVRASTITIDTVPVGDAGNAADSAAHSGNASDQGQVNYNYDIGKYDVTLTQYTAFLNSVASTDTYGLYDNSMATDLNVAGISRSGSSGSYSYAVIGSGQRPVTYVSWFDGIRFANWLSNSQGSGSTESGTYTITGGGPNSGIVIMPNAAQRAAWATGGDGVHWLLPSEDEWYKAAYYKSGGTNAGYWTYPTKSDSAPLSQAPSGGLNSANFIYPPTGYAVTQSTIYSSTHNYLTDVGAYSGSAGPYGTFDQGGDVWQWNETFSSSIYGVRGGGWDGYSDNLVSSSRGSTSGPSIEGSDLGFRVASIAAVPEPGTIALLLAGAVAFAIWRRRNTATGS